MFTGCLATVVLRTHLLHDVTASWGRVFTERCVMLGVGVHDITLRPQSSRDPYFLLRHPHHNMLNMGHTYGTITGIMDVIK